MAIHKTVYVTPDRAWRITADPAGTKFTLYKHGEYVVVCLSIPELEAFLGAFGITLADLEEG